MKNCREEELIDRAVKRVKLPSDAWNSLREDLKEKMAKKLICQRYRIKPYDLKLIKKYLSCA